MSVNVCDLSDSTTLLRVSLKRRVKYNAENPLHTPDRCVAEMVTDFFQFHFLPSLPSKSTSPTSLSFPVKGSCILLMPTSMTAAPSLIISAVMRLGIPSRNIRDGKI